MDERQKVIHEGYVRAHEAAGKPPRPVVEALLKTLQKREAEKPSPDSGDSPENDEKDPLVLAIEHYRKKLGVDWKELGI